MELHYNAFISYRHHPDDIRVATDIHRSLERFKVPKAIRKRGKRIERLFRDKDELPITSCLTDDITRALENADFLIVICSVHTKESVWVQREIETFLKTHDRNRVLTVLAGGEPYDVIPEILLYEDVKDPVTGEIKKVEIEPLSCDWRMSRKKAVREELPRLAAALLGCGYDELRQRQRQYRMRRMITLFSAALVASLGLMAYFLHTSIQIQKANDELHEANEIITAANEEIRQANIEIQDNLDQALWNQSEYLASSAGERMDAGDRLTAISLALAALPTEEGERPYVPAAEQALSTALSSYEAEAEIMALGAFRADALIRDFCVTQDGTAIYIKDARNTVTVWDTATFQKLGTIDMTACSNFDMLVTSGGNIICETDDDETNLFCYSPDGTLLWDERYCRDTAIQTDGTVLFVLQYEAHDSCRILFLDPESGEQVRGSIELPDKGLECYLSGFMQEKYQPQWPLTLQYSEGEYNCLYLLDTQTEKLWELLYTQDVSGSAEGSMDCVSFNRDGNVLVYINDGRGAMNGWYQAFSFSSPAGEIICCYDRDSGKVLWKSEITTHVYNSLRVIEQIPETDNILCLSGNTFMVLDGSTGKELASCVAPTIPLTIQVETENAWGMLQNGSYFRYDYAENTCQTLQYVDATLLKADINGGMYALGELGTEVVVYRYTSDKSGVAFTGDGISSISYRAVKDNLLALASYSKLTLIDMAKNEQLWSVDYSGSYELLGFSPDGTCLQSWASYDNAILRHDIATGAVEETAVPVEFDDIYTYFDAPAFYSGTYLYYMIEGENFLRLCRYDMVTNERTDWALQGMPEADYSKSSAILGANEKYVWYWNEAGTVTELKLADGTTRTLMTDAQSQPKCLLEDGRLILAAGSQVLCVVPGGEELCTFSLGEAKASSMFVYKEQLLILCDDGDIYRFNEDGVLLSKIEQTVFDTFYTNIKFPPDDPLAISWHVTGEGDLIVNSYNAGNIINTEHWQCRAFVPYFLTYYAEDNKMITRSGSTLMAYTPYTTQQQMERAREELNGYELSDELKAFYGLD